MTGVPTGEVGEPSVDGWWDLKSQRDVPVMATITRTAAIVFSRREMRPSGDFLIAFWLDEVEVFGL